MLQTSVKLACSSHMKPINMSAYMIYPRWIAKPGSPQT